MAKYAILFHLPATEKQVLYKKEIKLISPPQGIMYFISFSFYREKQLNLIYKKIIYSTAKQEFR